MHRIFLFIGGLFSAALLISCSTTTKVTQQKDTEGEVEVRKYPSWYSSRSLVSEDSVMYAYATALDSDSAAAASKAVEWATSELKSGVSDKLENIRSEAVVEYGSGYGLDSSKFLIALRKADNAVGNLVKVRNTKVEKVEGHDSYRGFAQIMVPKYELIDRIGKRLAGYEKAWNAMKESEAFKNF